MAEENTRHLDVNPAFANWKQAPPEQKESALFALVDLLREHARRVCWMRMADHQSDFPTVISNASWRAVKGLERFNGQSKFSTWYHRIVLNEISRTLKTAQTRAEVALDDDMLRVIDRGSDGTSDASIDFRRIERKLEGDDLALFRARSNGASFRELGKLFGITAGAAKVRWCRLMEQLKHEAR